MREHNSSDAYISLTQATKYFEVDGKKPHPSTLFRWCMDGLAGGKVKLEHRRYGRKIVTSPAACDQFSRELAAAKSEAYANRHPTTNRLIGKEDKSIANAKRELEADVGCKSHVTATTKQRIQSFLDAETELEKAGI